MVGGAAVLSGGWACVRMAKLGLASDVLPGLVEFALWIVALALASSAWTRRRLEALPAIVGSAAWLLIVLAGCLAASSFDPKVAELPATSILWLLFAP